MTDPLAQVWRRWDQGSFFTADDVADWPAGTVERFVTLGWLRVLSLAGSVVCDACEDAHDARVTWVGEGASRRGRYRCPTVGHVSVEAERVQRWDINGERMVTGIVEAVGVAGGITASIPGRVWRLGKLTVGGKVWNAFVARGLSQPNGESVAAREPGLAAANALVFVPGEPPPRAVWGAGPVPVVVRLADLLMLQNGALTADREFLASCCGTDGKAAPAATFPTPAGATWKDVTLTVGDRTLTVAVGDVVRRFAHNEIGFADRRGTGKPTGPWAVLAALAATGGVAPRPAATGKVKQSATQSLTNLRARLKAVLGIAADPLQFHRPAGEYRAAFRIRADGPATFTLPGRGWEAVSITELADGTVEVSVDGTGHADGFDDRAGDDGERAAAERTTSWVRRVSLTALGLAVDGVPTPEGTALRAVLRGGGAVRGDTSDATFLKLGKVLTAAFQTRTPPFDCRGGRWVAAFAAESRADP